MYAGDDLVQILTLFAVLAGPVTVGVSAILCAVVVVGIVKLARK